MASSPVAIFRTMVLCDSVKQSGATADAFQNFTGRRFRVPPEAP